VLETPRLILRQHRLTDFEPAYAMYSDVEVTRHIGNGKPATRQDVWHRVLRFSGHWQLLGYGMFAIVEKATGRFVGETGLCDFCRELGPDFDPFPEAAWIMARDSFGKGYATEAARAAHEWHEANRGPQRTVCIIAPENHASLRIAQKLGYRAIGPRGYRDETVTVFERTP
jgi:RimJ/RimL family protein N-acetyltransferase